MPRLPSRFAAVILCFAPLFRQRSWRHAEVLLLGAILAPGQRTVASLLRISGLGGERRFANYHRVLNRAAWSGRAAARVLLGLLLNAFAPAGPVLLGLDDTIERRRGKRIKAKGIYRDPVRSSKGHFVKASGLRWLSADAARPDPLGRPGLGAALPDRAGAVGAPLPRARPTPQEADRLGAPVHPAGPALDARRAAMVLVADSGFAALELLGALARRGASPASPVSASTPPSTCRRHRADPGPSAGPGPRGRACRTSRAGAGRPGHAMAARDGARLVRRRRRTDARDPLRHRGLVSPPACRSCRSVGC